MKKLSFLLLFLVNCLFAQSYLVTDSLNKSIFFGDRYPLVLDTVNVNLDSIAVTNLKDSVIVKNFPDSINISNFRDTLKTYIFETQSISASADSVSITTGTNNVRQLIRTGAKSKGLFIVNNTNRVILLSFQNKGIFSILQPQTSHFLEDRFTNLNLFVTTTSASATGFIFLTNIN